MSNQISATVQKLSIADSKSAVDQQIAAWHDARKKLQSEYFAEIERIQSLCDHQFTYVPDPSGNNDSTYICVGCNLEKRHLDESDQEWKK